MENFKTTYNPDTKTWNGLKIPIRYNAESSIGKVALETMTKYPKLIAQICYHNGKEYTFEEIEHFSKSVAQQFTKLGLQQGDVIGICASNSDFIAPLLFGALLKGLIISTLDVTYEKEGIKHTFNMTKPKLMFCDGGNYERVEEAIKELNLNIQIFTMKDHLDGKPEITEFLKNDIKGFSLEPLEKGSSSIAIILCSSGTTGLPKAVTMSHEDLLNFQFLEFTTEDRFLCFSSLHWLTGVYTLIHGTINGLTRIISDKGFSEDDFFNMVAKYKVRILLTPPSQMGLALLSPKIKTADLSSVRKYLCGGSAVSYAIIKQMKNYMPNAKFYTGYGMSEARTAIAMGESAEKLGYVGQLGANVTVKIVDENGKRLGPNEVGELCFEYILKWNGYYGNLEATKNAYDAEGWICTGDVGYINDEGLVFIVDRKKDILKFNNFHYFPTEIEHVIHELDDVVEVCVCGIPDMISSDLPAAAIVKKASSNLTEADIYEHVAKRMEHFKHLRGGVYFLDKMPLTPTGKILRREIRNICQRLRNEKIKSDVKQLPVEITSF